MRSSLGTVQLENIELNEELKIPLDVLKVEILGRLGSGNLGEVFQRRMEWSLCCSQKVE